MELNSPLDSLKGIGEKTKQRFSTVGIDNIGDLLEYYPRTYEQYGDSRAIGSLSEGEVAAVSAALTAPIANRYYRGRCVSSAVCCDGRDELQLIWYNMPYIRNYLRTGMIYIFRGKIKKKGWRLLIEQPAVFHTEQYQNLTNSLQPVYSLTKGLTVNMVQKAVRQVLDDLTEKDVEDYLPLYERERYSLCPYTDAIRQMHFPKDAEALRTARRRLVFDEFFFFLLQLRSLKEHRTKAVCDFRIHPAKAVDQVISSLPYELTGAQQRVWADIERELQGQTAMARLIQGDVGSGKTILAVLALFMVAENGYQGAMMAPTEVLARQHFHSILELIQNNNLPFEAVLLTGSMTAKQKRETYSRIESGEAAIVIGTHALIQEKVTFQTLALVITDEQHRFGVKQRELLSQKGGTPHTIVMSATPIPRTLAVILYGDLDISVLNEMPAKRLPIKNCVVGPSYRPKAYQFIQKQVEMGHQAYVICPMVDEGTAAETSREADKQDGSLSNACNLENVVDYTQKLRRILPAGIAVEYLHGRMKAAEKNEIMEKFLENKIQVLVSTTVVEVGVNVPNATVMMVENAERFGLSSLHQLRGRVGRGDAQSYCIFLHAVDGARIQERLDILNHTNDGFEIASKDLQLRGPGDLFGIRQSGLMNFQLADVYTDADVLKLANEAVNDIQNEDPELSLPEHMELKKRYEELLSRQSESLNL
ncbi:MAG: ATP-dependent DNA helicase RecG [Clostridiales bacterium]|nr:ATP-dependent DNA helicase RecG [Clostridiales bacterium]